ncbi:tail protein [Caballeronia fortuita]|uniref:Tail protein n=1 Tax=Caballeronia fortuita TaxID=1777138 RepID=A0A158E9L7_9BURK|nr:tail protein X [Caballeronia fortuita]SAL03076.1 tail protein [Caballeronia fortuita]
MSLTYITRDGDTLDYIAWKQYGAATTAIVNALLAANFGLADLGPVLSAGVSVVLPTIDADTKKATTQEVTLWT